MTEMPPKSWTIADAQPEDAESLSRMHAQSWRDTYVGIQPGITEEWVEDQVSRKKESPEAIERYKKHIHDAVVDPKHWLYKLAKGHDGEVVGLILASRDEDSQHLASFYVEKSFQGLGLAQELASCLDNWMDISLDTKLEVAVNNDRAIAFYEKLGFEVVPGSEHDPGDGLREINMIKPGIKMTEVLYEDRRFEIELATPEDSVGIGEAHLQSWLETYPNEEYGVTEGWIRDEFGFLTEEGQQEDGTDKGVTFRRKLLATPDQNRLYEVVKDEEGKVQGFLHVTKKDGVAVLDALYLTSSLLGKGVGKEFMNHALAFSGDLPVELEVVAYNEKAIGFYEKFGFVRGEVSPEYFHDKIPIMSMKRSAR